MQRASWEACGVLWYVLFYSFLFYFWNNCTGLLRTNRGKCCGLELNLISREIKKKKRKFLSIKIYVHADSVKSKLGLTAKNHTLGYQFQSWHFWKWELSNFSPQKLAVIIYDISKKCKLTTNFFYIMSLKF